MKALIPKQRRGVGDAADPILLGMVKGGPLFGIFRSSLVGFSYT